MKNHNLANGRRDNRMGWLMAAPFLIMFVFFKLIPMLYGLLISFWGRNSAGKLTDMTFVGFRNFKNALTSTTFWTCLGNSIEFALIYTVVLMLLGFLIAILFNREFRGRTFVRTCFYMPYVTNMIAVGVVFKYLLNPTKGPVNAIFRVLGVTAPKWLNSPTMALPTTAVIAAWAGLAFNIITCLAALQDVPKDLFEVADLEGANFWQKVRYVILPYLAPTLFMLLTITMINSFKNYAVIVGLTGGGPGTASRVLSLQIYEDAFNNMKFSLASAEGVLFTVVIVLLNKAINMWRSAWERK